MAVIFYSLKGLIFTCLLLVSAPTTVGETNPVRDPNVLEIPISVPTVINNTKIIIRTL